MTIKGRLIRFWDKHYEAIIVGCVAMTVNIGTQMVYTKIIKGERVAFIEVLDPTEYGEILPRVPIKVVVHHQNGIKGHAITYPEGHPNHITDDQIRKALGR